MNDVLRGATIRVSKACACGATMQATYSGDQEVGEELEAAWYQMHSGVGHGPATSKEAAKTRRRVLLKEQT
jgi:hypothetical protein